MSNYIFFHKLDLIDSFISNLNRKAISECLSNLLLANVEIESKFTEIKIEILQKLLTLILEIQIKTTDDNDIQNIENISLLIYNLLSQRKIFTLFLDNINLTELLHKIVLQNLTNEEVNKDLLKILIKLNENILKEFGVNFNSFLNSDKDTAQENEDVNAIVNLYINPTAKNDEVNSLVGNTDKIKENSDLLEKLEKMINISVNSCLNISEDFSRDNLSHNKIDTTYDKKIKILGLKKLLEFEYIKNIMQILLNAEAVNLFKNNSEILNKFFDVLIKNNFFEKIIENLFIYQMNNIYHHLFQQFINIICSEFTPNYVIEELLIKTNFLENIINFCEEEKKLKFSFNSGRVINSGILSILCDVGEIIYLSKNEKIKEIIFHKVKENEPTHIGNKFEIFVKSFIIPIVKQFKSIMDIKKDGMEGKVMSFDSLYGSVEKENSITKKEEEKFEQIPINELIKNGIEIYHKGGPVEKIEEKKDEKCYEDDIEKVIFFLSFYIKFFL
jgi:hypothetical protein